MDDGQLHLYSVKTLIPLNAATDMLDWLICEPLDDKSHGRIVGRGGVFDQ